MSRISDVFAGLSKDGEGAYIPYICAGDPDKDFTVSLAGELLKAGADMIELGIPFSDPVADGPVIQGAMSRSLEGGFKVPGTFEVVEAIRRKGFEQPIVLMTYSNPVLRMGLDRFCANASKSGADAVLLVDMPLEESSQLDAQAGMRGLDVIRMVAPSTTDERLAEIVSRGSGFVYAVSDSGVTGARVSISESAKSLLSRAVRASNLPVVLGFGISTPRHVREALMAGANGVVEGTALASIYGPLLAVREHAIEEAARHAAAMKASTPLVRAHGRDE